MDSDKKPEASPTASELTTKLVSQSVLDQLPPGSPTDVTLKLSDGSIDAHKMILAAVSPVFERMFYGDFKEAKSREVDLPMDSYKVMKILIDFCYKGSCELEYLDDILSFVEFVDRYQIDKVSVQHLCDETILSQIDSSNYLTLLPKYVSMISEECHKKAADKVMSYTNNDFVTLFDQTKDLPEEVLLPLLNSSGITCHEIDVFEYLVKWHNHQTIDLGQSLQLTQQLFQCVRYSLIIPQLLSSKVASSNLVDKALLSKVYDYVYHSCKPLGQYGRSDTCLHFSAEQKTRKPNLSMKIEWLCHDKVSLSYPDANTCRVNYNPSKMQVYGHIIKSVPLQNGIYTFDLFGVYPTNANPLLAISDQDGKISFPQTLCNNSLVTLNVHNTSVFIKVIENDSTVKSTITATASYPLTIYLCSAAKPENRSCTFSMSMHCIS